jgi:cytoskeletal protein RodZ
VVESLGEKLKKTRESKGIDFDQAGKDTKIAVRYLEALEREDFSGFPGEAYITGFLKNYGAYLELDDKELLSLYRMLKMQEQPTPVEQLLKRPSPLPKITLGVAVFLIALGVVIGIFFLVSRPRDPKRVTAPPRSPTEYVMSGDVFEQRFYQGDSILIPVVLVSSSENQPSQLKLELENLGEVVTVRTPDGEILLELSQEVNVDVDNDGTFDVRVVAMDYDKNKANMGALLRFETYNDVPSFADSPAATSEPASIVGQSSPTVLLSSANPYPFTLQLQFQGYCMFRWEILQERDRQERNERYFQRADELIVQAQNGIRVWTSNAQAARFSVIGGGRTVPVELGNAGEVVVADIRWVRNEDSRFHLVVSRLEM